MCGRAGVMESVGKDEIAELYRSGLSFDEIGEKYGVHGICVKKYFYENFLGFERFKLKKERNKWR